MSSLQRRAQQRSRAGTGCTGGGGASPGCWSGREQWCTARARCPWGLAAGQLRGHRPPATATQQVACRACCLATQPNSPAPPAAPGARATAPRFRKIPGRASRARGEAPARHHASLLGSRLLELRLRAGRPRHPKQAWCRSARSHRSSSSRSWARLQPRRHHCHPRRQWHPFHWAHEARAAAATREGVGPWRRHPCTSGSAQPAAPSPCRHREAPWVAAAGETGGTPPILAPQQRRGQGLGWHCGQAGGGASAMSPPEAGPLLELELRSRARRGRESGARVLQRACNG